MSPDPKCSVDGPLDFNSATEKRENARDSNDNKREMQETLPLLGSWRLFVALTATFTQAASVASQASMNSAMVCMISDAYADDLNHTNDDNDEDNVTMRLRNQTGRDLKVGDEAWKLSWDSLTQSWVISAFFFGYFFVQLPSGVIVTRLGPKVCLTLGLIATGILHLLSIPTALYSLPSLYFVRVMTGLTCGLQYSGVFALIANWCPRQETSAMFALPWVGFGCGNSFMYLVSLCGCESGFQGGWPVVFYTLGILHILVGVVMLVGVTDFPTSNRFISHREANYIATYRVHGEKPKSIPYVRILRSMPVWAFLMGQLGYDYASYTIVTVGSVFLRDILKLPHWKINTISSVPFLITSPTSSIAGYAWDRLIARDIVSTTFTRKTNEAISKTLVASSICVLVYLPDGDFVGTFVVYLVASIGIQFSYVGFMANPGDLSPSHSGFLAGLGQTMATWVSFVIPVLTGNLTLEKTRQAWYVTFFIPVGLQAFGLLFYLWFGSGRLQDWATVKLSEQSPILSRDTTP